MGVPDKICVAPHQIFDYDLEIQEVGHNGAEEYIRKDALIEWLLKGVEASEICESEYGDAYAQAYQAVIDKLNSM